MSFCIVVLLVNMCVCHLYNKTYLLTYLLNRQFAYSLDSSPTGFHIVYAHIHSYNFPLELHDHYRYHSRMNSRMSIVAANVCKECNRHSVQDVGEVSRG